MEDQNMKFIQNKSYNDVIHSFTIQNVK